MSNAEPGWNAEPVGHQGTQVDITQRPATAVSGWFGVVVLAGCGWGIVVAAQRSSAWLWLPSVVAVLILASVIVTPGQTSVIQFFGRYIGTVLRPARSSSGRSPTPRSRRTRWRIT